MCKQGIRFLGAQTAQQISALLFVLHFFSLLPLLEALASHLAWVALAPGSLFNGCHIQRHCPDVDYGPGAEQMNHLCVE